MSAHLSAYKDNLKQMQKDLTSLKSLGVQSPSLTTGDAIFSFGSKRKEIKSLKTSIADNIKSANRTALTMADVINVESFDTETLNIESLSKTIEQTPSNKELLHAINEVAVSNLLTENAISKKYSKQKMGAYVEVLQEYQFTRYNELKVIIAQSYASHLHNLLHDYYKTNVESFDAKKPELNYVAKSLEALSLYKNNESDILSYVIDHVSRSNISTVNGLEKLKDTSVQLFQASDDKYSLAMAPSHDMLSKTTKVSEVIFALQEANKSVEEILLDINNHLFTYYKWSVTYSELSSHTQRVLNIFTECKINSKDWLSLMQAMYYRKLITVADSPSLLNDNTVIDRLISSNANIKSLLVETIAAKYSIERHVSIESLESGTLKFNSLYNKRGARGQRRNSLRKIIDRDFRLFTALFPVVICNPSSVASLFELKKDLFDTVLFDEASQLRLEDTYTSLYRGKTKVISGDQHQMPPSNYFQSVADGDDTEYEDDEDIQIGEMTNAESLLDYASINGYISEMLKIHYRSDHEDLIQFSNHAFYDAKLMPIPKFESYVPIEYMKVNGIYENRSNEAEADYVIQWLKNYFESKTDLQSVGVVTLNLPQSDLIKDKIASERTDNESFNLSMIKLDELGFFVKNLENVQGDERDIMILSTTFGRDKDGKFKQFFGPLSNQQGYRLLNVLVTRAKHKFIIATSIPDENINRYQDELNLAGKDKRAILYAYLAYARSVADGDTETKKYILNLLSSSGQEKIVDTSGYTESPFEEEVLEVLEQAIDKERIILQYQVGGENFRIDMVILNKDCTSPMLAIECDGYTYHSSPQAYLYDAYRREILKNKGGFDFYSIWSTNWFHDQRNEEAKLIATIRDYDSKQI